MSVTINKTSQENNEEDPIKYDDSSIINKHYDSAQSKLACMVNNDSKKTQAIE